MHEYSLVQAMFDRIDAVVSEQRAVAVRRVRVTIGDWSGVEPSLFETAYEIYRVRTPCEGAPLEIVRAPGSDLTLDQLELEVR